MRFGKRRGLLFLAAMATIFAMGMSATVRADGYHLHHTIPREAPAYDYSTGGEFYAPPVPYGHYAKDKAGHLLGAAGMAKGLVAGHCGKLACLLSKCFGACGHGCSSLHGCKTGDCGLGHGGGAGLGSGHELFHHGGFGGATGAGPIGPEFSGPGLATIGGGSGSAHGLLGHKRGFAPIHENVVVTGSSQITPAGQSAVATGVAGPCGMAGCGLGGKHSHVGNLMNKIRCRFCSGAGCGGCRGLGLGDPCGGCGGTGLLGHGGGHGSGGQPCNHCGGCGLAGLGAAAHGLASKLHGLMGLPLGLLGHNKVDYFVGPGGPVPLTPGYVPYIVTTRSPRDFFAFPPMNPNDP